MSTSGAGTIGAIFAIAFGSLCLVWVVITLGRAEFVTAITVFGFAVMLFALTAFFVKVTWGNVTAQGEFDATGTTLRPDRQSSMLIRTSVIGGVLAMALFAVLQPLGKLDIPVPHSMRYYLPFVSAIGAVNGAALLIRAIQRGSLSRLKLTPIGFEFMEGRAQSSGRWEVVDDIGYRPPKGPEPAANSIVFMMSDGQYHSIATGSYTTEGRALRTMVRFYWKHPESRYELTDGRALERLRDEDFPRRGSS